MGANYYLRVYRNPEYTTKNKEGVQRTVWEWLEVEATSIHNDTEAYGRGDLILYTGPDLYMIGQKKQVAFVSNQIYEVQGDLPRGSYTRTMGQLYLIPSGYAYASNKVPSVSTAYIRHVSVAKETRRIKVIQLKKEYDQISAINARFIGETPGYNIESRIYREHRVYLLQMRWYQPQLVERACKKFNIPFDHPGKIFASDEIVECMFNYVLERDPLAKVK